MDEILDALHFTAIILLLLAGAVIVFKIIFVFSRRGVSSSLFTNFFRIYKKNDFVTDRKARKRYMTLNNWLNYYIYFSIAFFLIILGVYQKNIFSF